MRLGRRTRMVLRWVWMLPAVGLTMDICASEVARWLGLGAYPMPWIFTAITLTCVPFVFLYTSLWCPNPREDQLQFDDALTQRSRVLTRRLGAEAVRVSVMRSEQRIGNCLLLLDRDDLLVSESFLKLSPGVRDFLIARLIAEKVIMSRLRPKPEYFLVAVVIGVWAIRISFIPGAPQLMACILLPFVLVLLSFVRALPVASWRHSSDAVALSATGDLESALAAIPLVPRARLKDEIAIDQKQLVQAWESGVAEEVQVKEWYMREVGKPTN